MAVLKLTELSNGNGIAIAMGLVSCGRILTFQLATGLPHRFCSYFAANDRPRILAACRLRAGEIIDGESVAIKDGVLGCEGQWGAESRVRGCDEACGQREVSRSFHAKSQII